MRRTPLVGLTLLIGCWLGLASAGPHTACAQQWTGTAGIGVSGGYQTNPYLDPVLGTWDPAVDPGFIALTPQVGIYRTGGRLELRGTMRTRWFPGRDGAPQFVQGAVASHYALSPRWDVGVLAGGSRYRLRSARDTGWLLPSIRFHPTDGSRLTLRIGASQRAERTVSPTDQQTSALVTLSGRTWLTDRLRGMLRLYQTTGQTSVADAAFGGTGAEARLTYWPAPTVSLRGQVGLERLRYDTVSPDGEPTEASDQILQGGLEARWSVHPTATLFAQAHTLTADLARSTTSDVRVAAGVRVQLQRSLGGDSGGTPVVQPSLWQPTDDGVRFRVPYDGNGRLHLVGDFNGWSDPGIPLEETDDDLWTANIDLASGRYTYRIRVVTENGARWLDFPAYAQTTDDSFGGTNGVCIVP